MAEVARLESELKIVLGELRAAAESLELGRYTDRREAEATLDQLYAARDEVFRKLGQARTKSGRRTRVA